MDPSGKVHARASTPPALARGGSGSGGSAVHALAVRRGPSLESACKPPANPRHGGLTQLLLSDPPGSGGPDLGGSAAVLGADRRAGYPGQAAPLARPLRHRDAPLGLVHIRPPGHGLSVSLLWAH